VLENPDDPGGQPDVRFRVVPVLDPPLRAEPPHDGRVLDVHVLEHPLRQVPVGGKLVRQPEMEPQNSVVRG
jgi:hypothetical protein